MSDFVDFAAIKDRVTMEAAISFLNLKLTRQEHDQLRFACPACKGGDARALSVNIKEGKYRCFEDKGKGGTDSIALVAHVKGIRQREAAVMLDEHFPAIAQRAPSQPKAEPEGRREEADTALDPNHPVAELLGLSAATLEALEGGYSHQEARIMVPLRLPNGTMIGHLGIATDAAQKPLLQFPEGLEEKCKPPKVAHDELRKLLRVV